MQKAKEAEAELNKLDANFLDQNLIEHRQQEKITFVMNRIKQITVYSGHLDIDFMGYIVAAFEKNKDLNVITTRAPQAVDSALDLPGA